MRTEPPETARVLDAGLDAAPVVALAAFACLVGIGISVLSVVNDDPSVAMGSSLVALASIPFGIATARHVRGSRMDASGVWKARWYGWCFYSADEIESVEWYVAEEEGIPHLRVLLKMYGRWSTVQAFHSPAGGNRAEAVATEVEDLLGRPVRRDSSRDQSERFRDW